MLFNNGAVMAQSRPFGTRTVSCSPPKAGEHDLLYSCTPENGAENGAITAQIVIARLEDAGRTLLALPHTGYTTKLRTSQLDIIRTAVESYGWEGGRLRAAYPDARQVTQMDAALAWIPLIPRDRYVLRRIVGARALVSPTTERHLFPWRRLGALLGADHKAIQRWHAQGIDLIVQLLTATVR